LKFFKNILIVNSNAPQLKNYAQFLTKNGFNILASTQFASTLDIVQNKKPDILVLFVQKRDTPVDYSLYLNHTNKLILINNSNIQLTEIESNSLIIQNNLLDEITLLGFCMDVNTYTTPTNDLNILIVEGNPLNQLYFEKVISELDIKFQTCAGFSEAIYLVKNSSFDLIISDFLLKDGHGIELLKTISTELKLQMPFILISESSEQELKDTYGEFNCYAFLVKPLYKSELKTVITTCLKLDHINNEPPTNYDFSQIVKILKNDTQKIDQSVKEFKGKLSNALTLIDDVLNNSKFEIMRDAFHDVLNLSVYFGADRLFNLVMKFRETKVADEKKHILKEIKTELNHVYLFYKDFKYN
jgi:DNA-binding response OmpR family regulator